MYILKKFINLSEQRKSKMHSDFENCVSFGLHMNKTCWGKTPAIMKKKGGDSSERQEPSDYDAGLTPVKGHRTWRVYTEM